MEEDQKGFKVTDTRRPFTDGDDAEPDKYERYEKPCAERAEEEASRQYSISPLLYCL